MPMTEPERFRAVWEMESALTARLLEAIPDGKHDFRPDPGGRSLGEMAWHPAEVEGYLSDGMSKGAVTFQDAVARLAKLTDADLDRENPFAGDRRLTIRDCLWGALLMHLIHHRGQLSLMVQLAGGTPPAIYGPNREEMAAMRERVQAARV
jgi:uncharacterized damage-inducible protein DinB